MYGQSARTARSAAGSAAGGPLERRVLDEDRPLELLELDARLQSELVDEERASAAVDLESFRLPARPIQRKHQLRPEPLAVGVLLDERLELGDERRVAAECELGVDALLDRAEPHFFESLHLNARERLEFEVGKRAAVPQPLGTAQELCRSTRIAGGQRLACRRDQLLEELDVELVWLDPQEVSRCPGHEPRLVSHRGQHLAQARDVVSQRVIGGVHALLREEFCDEPVARDNAVRAQEQQREERPLLRPAGRDLAFRRSGH